MPRPRGAFIAVVLLIPAAVWLSGFAGALEGDALPTAIVPLYHSGEDPDLTLKLKEGIALLGDAPSSPEALARAYRSSLAPVRPTLAPGREWTLVSAGPLLDSPDQAEVAEAVLDGRTLRIAAVHTSARLRGAGLRRNRPWRPLLTMKLDPGLAPGDYRVEVAWRALESLPAGRELAAPLRLEPLMFTVPPR